MIKRFYEMKEFKEDWEEDVDENGNELSVNNIESLGWVNLPEKGHPIPTEVDNYIFGRW